MKEEVLKQIIERLKDTKKEIIDKINSYEEQIKNYKESNKELNDSLSIEVYNEKTEKWTNSLKACKDVNETVERLEGMIKTQKELVDYLLKYNLTFGDLDNFFDLVLNIDGFNVQNYFNECCDLSKVTKVPFPYKASDLTNFNKARMAIIMKADYMVESQRNFITHTHDEKLNTAKDLVQMINKAKMTSFFDKLIKYFSDNKRRIAAIAVENGEKIQEIRESEIKKRKDEIKSNIDELNRKIDECKKSLVSIGEIYSLYDKYKEDQDQNTLIKLTEELANLVAISQRESKILKHEEKEEVEEIETKEEKPVEEVKKEEIIPEVRTLDNDYFRRKDTKHLICFLGDENDSIRDDIIKHFDNSARKPVLSELYSIFNSLALDTDYIKDKGGNPHSGSSKNALALLKSPFNFEYRRYGVRNDGFRIHAISRYSSLLEELGYGSGKIVFFGAVGLNDDKLKSDAYSRLGKRAIEERSNRGKVAKLRPNFDFIEHITRRYIPIKLLSEGDKSILNYIGFNGKTKGSIDTTIENKKYVLYDLLDEQSKKNVKDYLDEYFINQTTMLFDIINDYKKVDTLD